MDPTIVFWKAVGLLKEGLANEAVRELDSLARRVDIQLQLPVRVALLHAHRACRVVDAEVVSRLESENSCAEDEAVPDRARMQTALLLWHLGEVYDSKRHVHHLLRMQPQSVQAHTLNGWLELAEAEQELACNGTYLPPIHHAEVSNLKRTRASTSRVMPSTFR